MSILFSVNCERTSLFPMECDLDPPLKHLQSGEQVSFSKNPRLSMRKVPYPYHSIKE